MTGKGGNLKENDSWKYKWTCQHLRSYCRDIMWMISGVTFIPGLPVLRLWVLTILVLWASLARTSQGQIHGRNGPFDRVVRLLRQKEDSKQGTTLDLVQTQLLIDTLLQRVDCYSTTNPEVCDWVRLFSGLLQHALALHAAIVGMWQVVTVC